MGELVVTEKETEMAFMAYTEFEKYKIAKHNLKTLCKILICFILGKTGQPPNKY